MKKRSRTRSRKSSNKKTPPVFKYVFIGLLIVGGTFILSHNIIDYLRNTRLFSVRSIIYDPTIPFHQSPDIMRLKGKSIFDIDVETLQTRLRGQYPQIAYLKVVKRFPDQLIVLAKKRDAAAHIEISGRDYVIDTDGVVIADKGEHDSHLPVIRGLRASRMVRLGFKLRAQHLPVALRIIQAYNSLPAFAAYPIKRVEMGNLSKIRLVIGPHLDIILDKDRVQDKLKILELIFTQGKLDLSTVKYIDLRFKEPVLGKR